LNGSNTMNGNNTSRDVYDKKRKLMETLDNFGVRKRTRQEVIYKVILIKLVHTTKCEPKHY